jgi:hypothetical protein
MAEQRMSLGLGFGADQFGGRTNHATGPVLELDLGEWSAEMRGTSSEQLDSFLLEIRRPFRESLSLIGGTRLDRVHLPDRNLRYDGDALFAGLRFHFQGSRLSPFGAVRLLHGSATVTTSGVPKLMDVKGIGIDAGFVLPLPARATTPLLRRTASLELVPTLEFQRLDPVDLEFIGVSLRLRYAMQQ